MQQVRRAGLTIFSWSLVLLLTACSSPPPQTPAADDAYSTVLNVDGNAHKLKVAHVGAITHSDIDITGLDVDLDCARSKDMSSDAGKIRVTLLARGCAEITPGTTAPDAEVSAQQQAQHAELGRWEKGFWTKLRRAWDASLEWLGKYWEKVLAVLGAIVGLASVPFVYRALSKAWQFRHHRPVHIVFVGLASSGKSALWTAWRKDVAPLDMKPTTGIHETDDLPSVRYGKDTLYPQLVDHAGSEPWNLRKIMRAAPRRALRILVVVLSPRAENVSHNGSNVLDQTYVVEQRGYLSVVRALLGDIPRVRPHQVLMFVTKFDLMSDEAPTDSANRAVLKEVNDAFATHKYMIESQCESNSIPFHYLVGSSTKPWAVNDLRDALRQVTP